MLDKNPSSQALFSSNILSPLSKMKITTLPSFPSEILIEQMMPCVALVPSCHFLSVITNARCPQVKSASCSRRGQLGGGEEEDKANVLGGSLIPSRAGPALKRGFPAYWGEVINVIKVFKKEILPQTMSLSSGLLLCNSSSLPRGTDTFDLVM